MKSGFTLVEVLVSSLIILVVLTALAFALQSFFRGSRSIELQDGALTLARVEISEIERLEEIPEPGFFSRVDTLWGHTYTVDTSITQSQYNTIDLDVSVSSGDTLSIELTRRFYIDNDNNTSRQEIL